MHSDQASCCFKLLAYTDSCWTCARSVAVKCHWTEVYVITALGKGCIINLLKIHDNSNILFKPLTTQYVQNSLHLISVCFLVSQQQRWVWLPPVCHTPPPQPRSMLFLGVADSSWWILVMSSWGIASTYMLHRKYEIRQEHIAWCTNKIMFV
jgi:hypothetical protein